MLILTSLSEFHQNFWAVFLPIFWCQNISYPKHSFVIFGAKILAQNACVKCWWNWPLVSISPTLYEQLLRDWPLVASLRKGRVNQWWKNSLNGDDKEGERRRVRAGQEMKSQTSSDKILLLSQQEKKIKGNQIKFVLSFFTR